MKIGFEKQSIGRYVIDIDGALRTTNSRLVNAEEIIALHGRLATDAAITWEVNGETIPLHRGDRVELSEDSVAFFRSSAVLGKKWITIVLVRISSAPRTSVVDLGTNCTTDSSVCERYFSSCPNLSMTVKSMT